MHKGSQRNKILPAAPAVAVLVAALLSIAGATQAGMYQYRDADGNVTFTDRPMGQGQTLVKQYNFHSRTVRSTAGRNPTPLPQRRAKYDPLIQSVSARVGLHPELIHAVVLAESAYDPEAVSRKGAVGLMQLMPGTAQRYGVRNRRDPGQNLRGGSLYLSDLLARYGDNLALALAAYNAGENAVDEYGQRIPPYPETQGYVRKVMAFYERNREGIR